MAHPVHLLSHYTMKFRLIIILLLLVAGAFVFTKFRPGSGRGKESEGKGASGPKAVPVTVTDVQKRDVPIWLSGLGTVEAYNKVTIRPQVNGALDEINFTEGQTVKEGDIIARIDPRPYESLLAQAQAKVAQSDAQVLSAKQDLSRTAKLVETGAESRQLFDQLEANVAQYDAQQKADVAAQGAAQLNLDFTSVKSPIAGRTGVRMIDKGNLVTANQTEGLVVITQFEPISVIFTLPQGNLPELQKRMANGKDAPVVQAMKDDGKVLAEGKLELIDNQIDTSTGTLKLKATFPNKDHALWPGQFLTARVLVETLVQTPVIPTQVITAGLDGPFAYVVKEDGTVEPRNVTPGPRVDGITVIEKGLEPGEKVVLDGQSKLQPGAHTSIQTEKKP